jgi:hypothetical protein
VAVAEASFGQDLSRSSMSAASSERRMISRPFPPSDAMMPTLLSRYCAFAIFCIRVTADGSETGRMSMSSAAKSAAKLACGSSRTLA